MDEAERRNRGEVRDDISDHDDNDDDDNDPSKEDSSSYDNYLC